MLDPIPIIKSFYFSIVIMWHIKYITTILHIPKRVFKYSVLATKEYLNTIHLSPNLSNFVWYMLLYIPTTSSVTLVHCTLVPNS